MKRKIFILALLVSVAMAAAQTGLMGGSDGIHQVNANSLGKWRFVVGTGGNVTVDPWALSRGGVFYDDGQRKKLQDFKLSATGNFFIGMGLTDHLDVGVGLPINYDRSYAHSYLDAATNIRQGDLDFWVKGRAPFISDSSMFQLALQLDLFMPTGSKKIGLRPRHAWFINGRGNTDPYSANEVVVGATAITSVDFNKKYDIPIRWNLALGFYYADEGSNTLIYSTGFDWDWSQYVTAFVEYSGEFRVENNGMPIDFWEDPMLLTPGLRLHLPYNIDLAGGLDLSPRMFRVAYDREKEMENADKFVVRYTDTEGKRKSYGYSPTVTYAFTGLLTWTFGGAEKAPERECPQGLPPAPDTVSKTVEIIDTLTRTDTIVVADTIRDADSDGIIDSLDQCPNTPMGFPVDSLGCPVDEDKDGVTDSLDKCPATPAEIQVGIDGCPLDFDKDGVPNHMDMCPNTAEGIGVDSTGCPMDEDKDGVSDTRDQCPLTPKGAPVDTTGCPIDTDKDGVPDYLDKCPNNLRGIKVDKKGCPVNKKEDLENLKKGINFKSGSTILTKPSYKTLDDIVALMIKVADVALEIQGHTDNVGDSTYNEELSQGRAQSVVDYMISKGIGSKRLRAMGYGPRKPIEDNKTKKGRAKNRRVELVPFYPEEEADKQ